jgi:hypothetical protein
MECTVSSSMAIVGWYKEKTKLSDGDKYNISKDMSGICRLTIKNCELNDSGKYYCRIEKQDDKTSSTLKVVGMLYKTINIVYIVYNNFYSFYE